MTTLPVNIPTRLAWRFESLLVGTFKRNKYRHHDYPRLAPLPTHRAATPPIEDTNESGPWIYFVVDGNQRVRYVGKSEERCILKRWIRPDDNALAPTYYWTHSTASGGNVFNIADGLRSGDGPFELRYGAMTSVNAQCGSPAGLKQTEAYLISLLDPDWNRRA